MKHLKCLKLLHCALHLPVYVCVFGSLSHADYSLFISAQWAFGHLELAIKKIKHFLQSSKGHVIEKAQKSIIVKYFSCRAKSLWQLSLIMCL